MFALMNLPDVWAAAAVLPSAISVHVMLIVATGAGLLVLLIYAGIALPAVWSGKPARRKAAADVLCQILALFRHR